METIRIRIHRSISISGGKRRLIDYTLINGQITSTTMLQSEETGKQWLAKIMTSFGLAGLQPSDPPWLMLLSVGHDEKPNQEEILVEVADSAPIRLT